MEVQMLDLRQQYALIQADVEEAVKRVFASQCFILGPEVERLEASLAAYSSCSHAIGMSSGTDAILAALMCENIGPGDEVITSPFTFFATGGCVARLGARLVFADIDPVSFNIRIDEIERCLTPRTRAIMPVHLYGQLADMQAISALAKQHNLVVIEDAAQAIGAENKGVRACSSGHYGCLSFYPTKNLGGAGHAGMVLTQDANLAERLRIMRLHGMSPRYYHKMIGGNFCMDALQAAVLNVKFPHLDEWISQRQAHAAEYNRMFNESGLAGNEVGLPAEVTDRHIYHQYVIRVPERDSLRDYLRNRGVGSEIYYPVPLHLQDCFAYLEYREGSLPESERAAKETLALPIYPELTAEQIQYVVNTIKEFYGQR